MDKIDNHQEFIDAIKSKNKLNLIFFSKEDNYNLERICAPMDYGPSRRENNGKNKYHFWDYTSDIKSHTLSISSDQIVSVRIIDEKFDPRNDFDFPIDDVEWFVDRDW